MNQTNKTDIQISILDKNIFKNTIITQVVDIHMQTFSGFFLTFLGKGFLHQLYEGFYTHPRSGLIVAEKEGRIVGFLAYSEDLSGFYKYLIGKSLFKFAWYSLGAFFRKPSSIVRLLKAFLKPGESRRDEKYIELSSIGVLPEMKNMHIGRQLIQRLKDQFNKELYSYIKLETDAVDNEDVNAFYVRNGFELAYTYETPEGRKMNEYRWQN